VVDAVTDHDVVDAVTDHDVVDAVTDHDVVDAVNCRRQQLKQWINEASL